MSHHIPSKSLQDVLTEHNLVRVEDLAECEILDQQDNTRGLPDVLLDRALVHEEDLVAAFAESLNLVEVKPLECTLPVELLKLIPEGLARTYQILPIELEGETLTVAVVDPFQLPIFDSIATYTGYKLHRVVSRRSTLRKAIKKYYGEDGSDEGEFMDDLFGEEDVTENPFESDTEQVNVDIAGAEEEPVVRIVRRILRDAMRAGASDIHIEPFEAFISLRYRIDGTLEDVKRPPKRYQPNIVARLKILSGCRIDERRIPQDGRMRIHFHGAPVDLRVAFLPCKHGEKVVLRILDKTSVSLDLESLNFEPQPLKALQTALRQPNGMILVTGPTGSGKTTTLYSALTILNTREVNIVTVEDPIEYEILGVNQVQAKASIGLTFANVLRQILRQDPDIVMVGEIRDLETADVAVKAALTGHLVLSTLHTNNAAGVYPRLIDMGVEPYLVQSSVVLSSAQRLLKRLCDKCAEPVDLSDEILESAQFDPSIFEGIPNFREPRGCESCREKGYSGRLAVLEAMPNDYEIGALAARKASEAEIKRAAMANGMRTLRQNALAKAARGTTSLVEVLATTASD